MLPRISSSKGIQIRCLEFLCLQKIRYTSGRETDKESLKKGVSLQEFREA